jgi:serine protease AprX
MFMKRRSQVSPENRPTDGHGRCEFIEPLEARLLMRSSHAPVPWGAWNQYIYQDAAVASFPTLTGRGETVAVLDTGISNVPSLRGKIVGGYNFINNNTNYSDTTGHGTSVAGVIAASQFTFQGRKYQGIAPGVKLVSLRIDDGINPTTDANMQAALQWVLNNSAKYNIVAVNISEGGSIAYPGAHTSIYSPQLAELAGRGIFVAAAAGNDSAHNGVDYPAADPNVFAVGSSNLADQPSSFTDSGPNLDLLAPGEYVITPTVINGRASFLNGTGTSYSTPIAVATAALIRQVSTNFTIQEIGNIERNTPFIDNDPSNGLSFPRLDLFNSLYVAIHTANPAHAKVFL